MKELFLLERDASGVIPEALQTDCLNCHERQKINTGRYLAYLLQYRPEYWDELLDKFDPDGTHRRKFGIDVDRFEEDDVVDKNADKRQVQSSLQRRDAAKFTTEIIAKNSNKKAQWIHNRITRDLEARLKSNLSSGDGKIMQQTDTDNNGRGSEVTEDKFFLKWPIRNIFWKLSRRFRSK